MSCPPRNKPPYMGEVDWVNQKVAAATGLSLKFMYQGDGIHPSTRAHQMEVDEYSKIQRDNDSMRGTVISECRECGEQIERPKQGRRLLSISQQVAMSEAWSRELRAKVQESERLSEAKKPQVCVEIDDYWD